MFRLRTYQTSIDEFAIDGTDKPSAVEFPGHDARKGRSIKERSRRGESLYRNVAKWIWSWLDDDTRPGLRQQKTSERAALLGDWRSACADGPVAVERDYFQWALVAVRNETSPQRILRAAVLSSIC